MTESLLYHLCFIFFALFCGAIGIAFLQRYRAFESFCLPFLLKKEVLLPKDRSLMVRVLRFLENELAKKLGKEVKLRCREEGGFSPRAFFAPIYALCHESAYFQEEIFFVDNEKNIKVTEMEELLHKRLAQGKKIELHFKKNSWSLFYE